MATWRDFAAYVKANYEITHEQSEMLRLRFETEKGRMQAVYLWHRQLRGPEDWVVIESPFAEVGQVDLEAVLTEAADMTVGGLVVVGRFVAVRDALPLANMDDNEFRRPLQLVTLYADRLEEKFSPHDSY